MLNQKFNSICFKTAAQESTVLKNFQLQKESKAIEGRPLIIKCDSNSLHKFTQNLTKPYDPSITQALIDTACDLMKYWGANLTFTHSDEIAFVFENAIPKTTNSMELLSVPYGGDLNNLLSLFAAKTTLLFNNYLSKDNRIAGFGARPEDLPCFKACAFSVPDLNWVVHWLAWRQKEGEKNYVDTAYDFLIKSDIAKDKKLEGVSLKDKIATLRSQGISIEALPLSQRYGTFILKKKELKSFSAQELQSMPEHKRPKGPVLRSIFIKEGLDIVTNNFDCIDRLFNPVHSQGETK